MMYGRDEDLNQVQQLVEELLWLEHVAGLWTHVIDSKKQALRGLKKITNDAQQWSMHKRLTKMNQNENKNTHMSQQQGE